MQMAAGLQPHFDQEDYGDDLGEEEEEQRRELIMACVSGVIAGVFVAFTHSQVLVSNSGEGGGNGVGRPSLSLDMYEVEYLSDHPFIGEVKIAGNLRLRHIQVTHSRLRASIHRLDPFVHDNMKCAIRRRTYHVESPNYIWHINGNHKLIRWRIVVHGGVDGYSRVIVFLKPSTNNLAATMLSRFERGVTDYGLLTCIRNTTH
uniref:Integrase core domain-containing protein n=1 Tax=Amphimedon queenslandica TaxID=400682 RepID=A0A1X7U5U9_AMPQE